MLKNLSFSAAAGKVVALVGPSGAGKSTIASLLLRFYDPQQGRILFDGRAATDYGLHELRRQMASCRRRCCSSADRSRRTSPTENRAPARRKSKAAARRANAHDFITAFPEGYGRSSANAA